MGICIFIAMTIPVLFQWLSRLSVHHLNVLGCSILYIVEEQDSYFQMFERHPVIRLFISIRPESSKHALWSMTAWPCKHITYGDNNVTSPLRDLTCLPMSCVAVTYHIAQLIGQWTVHFNSCLHHQPNSLYLSWCPWRLHGSYMAVASGRFKSKDELIDCYNTLQHLTFNVYQLSINLTWNLKSNQDPGGIKLSMLS